MRGGQGVAIRVTKDSAVHLGAESPRAAAQRKELPQIAALIDKEQFDLISNPSEGLVIVQGGAGSGKTTVALHRMAYLAHAQPARFRPSSMMFVVPSLPLKEYTKTLLPSLDVHGARVSIYGEWCRQTR